FPRLGHPGIGRSASVPAFLSNLCSIGRCWKHDRSSTHLYVNRLSMLGAPERPQNKYLKIVNKILWGILSGYCQEIDD
ncbi:MAG TPA: hypothetical protein PLA37_10295, partial [Anaerolineaceae bacterium]|nr:hypothetical protein [Anaerolineaceae bacterium]HQF46195.1 hypothetical protein [Anaerolineaceae bacterium]